MNMFSFIDVIARTSAIAKIIHITQKAMLPSYSATLPMSACLNTTHSVDGAKFRYCQYIRRHDRRRHSCNAIVIGHTFYNERRSDARAGIMISLSINLLEAIIIPSYTPRADEDSQAILTVADIESIILL